jgi:predicted metal-dependent HD superfamily phosphohydrolase
MHAIAHRAPASAAKATASRPDARASGQVALRDRFVALWRRHQRAGARDATDSVWHEVETRYAETHRHYHDLRHVAHCLRQLDLAGDRIAEPDQVEAAIWFHDVIVVPGRADNEQRSADLFRAMAGPLMDQGFVGAVVDLVLFTTHRTAPAHADHRFICDIDLSSFGSPWEAFLANSRAIEAEFPGPRAEYVRREIAFLESLLRRPRIFLTNFFHDRCEARARENIRRFLAMLATPGEP